MNTFSFAQGCPEAVPYMVRKHCFCAETHCRASLYQK